MATDKIHLQFLRSKDVLTGNTANLDVAKYFDNVSSPKLPSSEQLEYGEIALNIAKDHEVIAIKNYDGEVVYLPFNVASRLLSHEVDFDELKKYSYKSIEELSAATRTLEDKAQSLKGDIDNVSGSLNDSVDELNGKITTLESSLTKKIEDGDSSLRQSIVEVDTKYDTRCNEIDTRLSDKIDESINGVNSNIDEKYNELNDSIRNGNDALKSEIDKLSEDTDSRINALGENLSNTSSSLERKINILESDLTSKIDDTENRLTESINSGDEKVSKKIDELSQKTQNDISDLSSALEAKISKVSGDSVSRDDEIKQSIRDNVSEINGKIDSVNTSVNEKADALGARIDSLSAKTDADKLELEKEIEANSNSFNLEISNVKASIDEKTKAISAETDTKINSLRDTVNEEMGNIEANMNKSLEDNRTALEAKISKVSGDSVSRDEALEAKITSLSAETKNGLDTLGSAIDDVIGDLTELESTFNGNIDTLSGNTDNKFSEVYKSIANSESNAVNSAVTQSNEYTDRKFAEADDKTRALSGEVKADIATVYEDIKKSENELSGNVLSASSAYTDSSVEKLRLDMNIEDDNLSTRIDSLSAYTIDKVAKLKLGDLTDVDISGIEGDGLEVLSRKNGKWTNDIIPNATKSKAGLVRLGNGLTLNEGAVDVDPLEINERLFESLKKKADIDSPSFTGIPEAPTAVVGTNTRQIATTEFVQMAVNDSVEHSDALVYRGIAPVPLPETPKVGDTYLIGTPGKYDGEICETGDMIVCKTAKEYDENLGIWQRAEWFVIQKNVDGSPIAYDDIDRIFEAMNDN